MRKITYKIKRYDGVKSYWQEYSFDYEPGKTLLWGLTNIKDKLDSTLKFTASCRHAICGACAIRVNNQARLACSTPLDEMLDRFNSDMLIIEPINNFPVIKDLVVDWDDKVERLKQIKPWLDPKDKFSPEDGCTQSKEEHKKYDDQTGCILCGACASECNKLTCSEKDFYEPYVYAKASRFVNDSRDKASHQRVDFITKQGLWNCMRCIECTVKCPKNVAPGLEIIKLRSKSMQQGLTKNLGARHAYAFLTDIKNTGHLNETLLPIRTEGLLKTMKRTPFALRLIGKGKINPFHFPGKIKGIKELRVILKAAEEASKQ